MERGVFITHEELKELERLAEIGRKHEQNKEQELKYIPKASNSVIMHEKIQWTDAMNKYRLCSAMHDENKEQSQISKDYQQFIHAVRVFIGKYGITGTFNVIRQEIEKESKLK